MERGPGPVVGGRCMEKNGARCNRLTVLCTEKINSKLD